MYKWKIERINYISDKDLIGRDISGASMSIGDHIYNCYRRKWFFFWELKRQLKDFQYDRLKKAITEDGYDIRKLYKHVNF